MGSSSPPPYCSLCRGAGGREAVERAQAVERGSNGKTATTAKTEGDEKMRGTVSYTHLRAHETGAYL
eukprot:4924948-Pyramimonas_sp.AAC.1